MSIIRFEFGIRPKIPCTGHHNSAGWTGRDYTTGEELIYQGPVAYWTWEEYKGLCLRDRERNMYDDSDFYMLVWNEEKNEPEEILFATTRGWSYPAFNSSVDATPEIREKYRLWSIENEKKNLRARRAREINEKLTLRNEMRNLGKEIGFNYTVLLRLKRDKGHDYTRRIMNVMHSRYRIRNNFKLSLLNQIIEWVKGNGKYNTPLSEKQMRYL